MPRERRLRNEMRILRFPLHEESVDFFEIPVYIMTNQLSIIEATAILNVAWNYENKKELREAISKGKWINVHTREDPLRHKAWQADIINPDNEPPTIDTIIVYFSFDKLYFGLKKL